MFRLVQVRLALPQQGCARAQLSQLAAVLGHRLSQAPAALGHLAGCSQQWHLCRPAMIAVHPHNRLAAASSCLQSICLPPPRPRQDTFQEARAANASGGAAGAMFWGATVGDHIDWDGWQVRLDGGRTGEV